MTSLGRQISALPLDPRLARMLLAASHHRCVAEMLVIAAFLAAQDPRERPADAQPQADQKHAAFADPRSDFIAVLNLWKAFTEQSAALSGSQLRKWCRENFLSFMRMREWQELHRQLARHRRRAASCKPNQVPAEYADLHQAILTGFLGNIGALDERREYEGARGTRFVIAPERRSRRKPPKWIVAASLMETTRLYARMVAAVEPQWIEAAGEHLRQAQLQRAALGRGARLRRRVRIDVALRADAVVAPSRQLRQRRAGAKRSRSSCAKRSSKDARGCARRSSITIGACGAKWSSWRRRCVAATCSSTSRRYATSICSVCRRQVHSIAALEKWLRGAACRRGSACRCRAAI